MPAYPAPPFSWPVRLAVVYLVVGCGKLADALDVARDACRRLVGVP